MGRKAAGEGLKKGLPASDVGSFHCYGSGMAEFQHFTGASIITLAIGKVKG